MKWITESWARIRSVFRRRALENGLDEEIRFHIDQRTEKNRRAGMSADEARRQALIRFGGVDTVKENTRDEIRPALVEDSLRDLRHGVRVLRRAPGFTGAALATLALGIGATAAIFSVVRTVMLEPLPYHEPDRIVTVWEANRGGAVRNVIAPANFVAWRERTRTLEHLGMVGPAGVAMMINGQPLEISGLTLSADVFLALGVQPALGRAYTAEEDFGGNTAVIVLSHEFWQRRLGGRPDVLDMTLATDDGPRTVIGVMPAAFTVVGQKAEFLIPYGQTLEQLRAVRGRGSSYAIARLREGVSFERAYGEMRSLYAELEREEPQRNARRTVMLLSLQEQMVGELRPALFALVGAVVLVLLVACVNVANLLLARGAAREREVGMRTAFGASRGRLVRQMLTESLALAAAGGVAGLAVAALCHRGLLALVGDRIPVPRLDQVTIDLPVVVFTMVTALATGIVFGIVPAFVSTSHARDALRDAGRHGGGRRLHRVLRLLVIAEVALSLVLVVGAGLLMRSFLKLQSVDLGFRPEGASGSNDVEWTIVGVVGNIKSSLDGPVRQTIFVPLAQRPGRSMTIFVRTGQDPMLLATSVMRTVHAVEAEAPVDVRTLDEVIGSTIARPRAISMLLGVFALVALVLAAVGVYGVMAYSVRERTQEIGFRMALGATAASVLRLVLGQALRLVSIGIAAGLAAASVLTRLLERLLYEVEPLDPWTFAVTALGLLAVATIAAYVPARRGMQMAPVDALRTN